MRRETLTSDFKKFWNSNTTDHCDVDIIVPYVDAPQMLRIKAHKLVLCGKSGIGRQVAC